MNFKHLYSVVIIILSFFAENCFSSWYWDNAGLLPHTPKYAQYILNINDDYSGTPSQRVEDALDDARDNSLNGETTIIYFPSGTYTLTQTITLQYPDSNIIFQGAGSSLTHLEFNLNNSDLNCFEIIGDEMDPHLTTLSTSLNLLSDDITAYNLSDLNEGDWFRLSEYNHDVYNDDSDWAVGCVGQITRLVSKNGNNGVMMNYANKQYNYINNNNLRIYKINPVKNIGIENLHIRRVNTGHAGTGETGCTFVFKSAVNCWVKGVHSYQTCKHHILADYSAHIYISGCYFTEARWYRQGGYGYGVLLTGSTSKCLISNNIFKKLRHAMIVQAGANGNAFLFNYSREQYWE